MHKSLGIGLALSVIAACSAQPSSEANQAVPVPAATGANIANSARPATPASPEASEPAAAVVEKRQAAATARAEAAPSYDVEAYCVTVSEAVGGSYVIEKGCRDQERDALAEIRSREIPARVARYCGEVAEAVGGSYVIFNGCVDQELGAAAEL